MCAAAAGVSHISIPIFTKDEYSLDVVGEYDVNGKKLPTLEHVLWELLCPELGIQPTHSSIYLRRKLRSKSKSMEEGIEKWTTNPTIQNEFISFWKQQIMSQKDSLEKVKQYAEMDPIPQFYCVIPKNKSMYKEWGWNPDMDGSMNRLAEAFQSLVRTFIVEKSVPTVREEEIVEESEDMMRNTFCPDCESLLFITQTKDDDGSATLSKKCHVCGWKERMKDEDMDKAIYKSQGESLSLSLTDHDIDEILEDPTLPRINNIPCVNPLCLTNHLIDDEYGYMVEHMSDKVKLETISKKERVEKAGDDGLVVFADTEEDLKQRMTEFGLKEEDGKIAKGPVERMILYYRTKQDDLNYSYVCSCCKTIWSNH